MNLKITLCCLERTVEIQRKKTNLENRKTFLT